MLLMASKVEIWLATETWVKGYHPFYYSTDESVQAVTLKSMMVVRAPQYRPWVQER